jgi:hypothetical protein
MGIGQHVARAKALKAKGLPVTSQRRISLVTGRLEPGRPMPTEFFQFGNSNITIKFTRKDAKVGLAAIATYNDMENFMIYLRKNKYIVKFPEKMLYSLPSNNRKEICEKVTEIILSAFKQTKWYVNNYGKEKPNED